MRISATAAVMALSAPTMLAAQSPQRIAATASAETRMSVYSYIPDHCQARGTTRIEITKPPQLGRATVRPDVAFTIAQSNYAACVGKPSTGTGLFYDSDKAGDDAMSVEVTYPDGHRETATFLITVTSAPSAPSAPR